MMGTRHEQNRQSQPRGNEAGEEKLRHDYQRLNDRIEAGENLRALGDFLELLLDQLQLLEIQEGVDRRHSDYEQHDSDEIRIAHDEHEAREGIAAERAIPFG